MRLNGFWSRKKLVALNLVEFKLSALGITGEGWGKEKKKRRRYYTLYPVLNDRCKLRSD